MANLPAPVVVFNSYPAGLTTQPFTISTEFPAALVLLDYYCAAPAGANARGVIYTAGSNEPYGSYNVGLLNESGGPIQFLGSTLAYTDANGNLRGHFDQVSYGVTFLLMLRSVVDGADSGVLPTNVSAFQQPTQTYDLNPGSGVLQVKAGQQDRRAEFTHYQYGTTIRAFGANSHIFEFFLGDNPNDGSNPQLSIRGNGNNRGASLHVRNASDTGDISLNADNPARYRLTMTGANLPDKMAIESPNANGHISFETNGVERVRVTKDGLMVGSTLLTQAKLQALLALV